MNPSLGLLLPFVLGQPPAPLAYSNPAANCAPCATAPATSGVPAHLLLPPTMATRYSCPPSGPPAPVLAVKTLLPDGVALFAGAGDVGHGSGALFGFRPGFAYRFRLEKDSASYGASLEVRGSIVPRPNMKYMEFPAYFSVTAQDLKVAAAGGVITKVIYLENPDKAIPLAERKNEALEVLAESEREAIELAELSGRIVAVLRIGNRAPSQKDLGDAFIVGTILLPGANKLSAPSVPPLFASGGIPLYDPILGPRPSQDECFLNGGDRGNAVGIGPDGKLGNLEPTDTVAEYSRGEKREVTVSNVVCLCSPRFVARRVETMPVGLNNAIAIVGAKQVFGQSVFKHRQFAEEMASRERTLGFDSRQRPGAAVALTLLHAVGSLHGLKAFAMSEGVQAVGVVVQVDEENSFPNRLTLTKSVEPQGPYQPGDVVTITLKYANNTRQPIKDIILSDSLSPRLEHVPGSDLADRLSNVTVTESETGTTVVRFDIPGPIPPNGTGTAVFKVKIR